MRRLSVAVMKNRKSFLAMLGMTGMTLSAAARTNAAPSAASAATPSPGTASAAPAASAAATGAAAGTAAAKAPSAVALATARTMRRFDAKLSDAEIETIAQGIDANAKAGAALNPKKKRLRNGDEPVATFAVRD